MSLGTVTHRVGLLSSLLAATMLLGGCSPQPAPTPDPQQSNLVGTAGLVDFDAGYLSIGNGPAIVDLYLDPICPYCKIFEASNGQFLFDKVDRNKATLRIHPVAVLDRLSNGTNYPTRAAAALVDVAANHPGSLRDYLSSLYEHQPAENTAGLSNTELTTLAEQAGATLNWHSLQSQYEQWIHEHTAQALQGPLPTTDVSALQQVPTAIVSGRLCTGNSDQTARFVAFYATKSGVHQ